MSELGMMIGYVLKVEKTKLQQLLEVNEFNKDKMNRKKKKKNDVSRCNVNVTEG
jgi:hypothetical protein